MTVDRNFLKLRFDPPLSISATKFLLAMEGNTQIAERIISRFSTYTLRVINSPYRSPWTEEDFPAA